MSENEVTFPPVHTTTQAVFGGTEPDEPTLAPTNSGPSLADRMRYQADLMASQRSMIFPVPGYQSMLAVELRALSLEATGRIAERHKRIQVETQRTLMVGCDIILSATEKFYEIAEVGLQMRELEGYNWDRFAQEVKGADPNISSRAKLLTLLGDVNVTLLIRLWDEWMSSEKIEIDKEVVEDFASTP